MNFFELLKFSLRADAELNAGPDMDWDTIHQIAREQSLLGLLFCGIERLPEEKRPPKTVLLKWFVESEQIKKQNEKVNKACVLITRMFDEGGIENCILKGQGNAQMYEHPYSRMSGDIDIWVNREKIKIADGYMIVGQQRLKVGKQVYHHIDVEPVGGVSVEVNTRPSFMNNLIHNKRMQTWFGEEAQKQYIHRIQLPDGEICVPTNFFNVIYQLAHISKHFFQDGIGLRHFVDYYYLLKNDVGDRDVIEKTLKRLGLYKLSRAVMYVESVILGLEDRYMIVPADERLGKLLYEEIMLSCNFGQYDQRVSSYNRNTTIGKNLERLKRDIRLMWYFPSECLSEPIFRLYHYYWRVKNL